MTSTLLDSFELDVDDRFTVGRDGDDRLSLTSTDPVVAVRCAVLDAHPETVDGRAALLAVSSIADDVKAAGGRVLNAASHGDNGHAILLEDERALERIFLLAIQRDHRVLLVQGRSPASTAGEADVLLADLIKPLGEAS